MGTFSPDGSQLAFIRDNNLYIRDLNEKEEMQFYPNKNHGIYGGSTTIHLYTRMTDFILENL